MDGAPLKPSYPNGARYRSTTSTAAATPGSQLMSPGHAQRVPGDQRGGHRDANRRSVLRNGARRHVQVHVGLLVEPRVDAVAGGVGAQPRQHRVRRLPHHVAKVSGQGQRACASVVTTQEAGAALRSVPPAAGPSPAARARSGGDASGGEERYDDDRSAAELQPFRDTADAAADVFKRFHLYMSSTPRRLHITNYSTFIDIGSLLQKPVIGRVFFAGSRRRGTVSGRDVASEGWR